MTDISTSSPDQTVPPTLAAMITFNAETLATTVEMKTETDILESTAAELTSILTEQMTLLDPVTARDDSTELRNEIPLAPVAGTEAIKVFTVSTTMEPDTTKADLETLTPEQG